MFYVIDALTGQWCHVSQALPDRKYLCDCPERHRVCLRRWRGKKRFIQSHFAHLPGTSGSCRGGGESNEHKAAKHRLREAIGTYSFVTRRCPVCRAETVETCGDGAIHIEVRSDDKRWWYDCVFRSNTGYSVALEVLHTHATTQEKIEATRKDGMQIAEFCADEINSMPEAPAHTRLHNLQVLSELCSDECRQTLELQQRERARKEEETRRQTEIRRLEEARRQACMRQRADARWQEETKLREAERQQIVARQQAEAIQQAEARQQAETRRLEQQRRLEEARRLEQENQQAETRRLAEILWYQELPRRLEDSVRMAQECRKKAESQINPSKSWSNLRIDEIWKTNPSQPIQKKQKIK